MHAYRVSAHKELAPQRGKYKQEIIAHSGLGTDIFGDSWVRSRSLRRADIGAESWRWGREMNVCNGTLMLSSTPEGQAQEQGR